MMVGASKWQMLRAKDQIVSKTNVAEVYGY